MFALAVVPGAFSVVVIWRRVRERRPDAASDTTGGRAASGAGGAAGASGDIAGMAGATDAPGLRRRLRLPASRRFRRMLVASLVFAVGNSSNAFILLKASSVGFSEKTGVILVYVLYNLTYAAGSLPLGSLSDSIGQFPVVAGGFVVFAIVYAGFAATQSMALVAVLFAAYGLYIAATEGTTKALISRTAPDAERASAMGFFDTSIGVASFAASAIGGLLWTHRRTLGDVRLWRRRGGPRRRPPHGLRTRDGAAPAEEPVMSSARRSARRRPKPRSGRRPGRPPR